METGARVVLSTFNGSAKAPAGCKSQENYWALIGQEGTILGFDAQLNRYLVQFDFSVQKLGLHCHNPQANSLYIQGIDLVAIGGIRNA